MPLQPQLLRGLRQIEPPNLLGRAQQVNTLRNQQLSIQQNELALNQQNQKAQQAQAVHDIIVKHGGDFEKALPEIRTVAPELSLQFESLVNERQDRTEAQADKRMARDVLGRNAAAQQFAAMEGSPAVTETIGTPGAMTQPESIAPPGGVAPIKSPLPASFDREIPRSVEFPSMPSVGQPGFTKKVQSARDLLMAKQSERKQDLDLQRQANTYTITDPATGKTVTAPKDVIDNILTQTGQDKRQFGQQSFTSSENDKNRQAAMERARVTAAARLQAVREAGLKGELSAKQVSVAMQLANSLKAHPAYTDMQDIATGMNGIEAGFAQKSGLGDIAAINSFQRMVDPGATVRSEDVGLIRSASALKERILSSYPIDKLTKGAVLPEAARAELKKVAVDLYSRRSKNYNDTVGNQYRGLAEASTIPFEYVGIDFPSKGTKGTVAYSHNGEMFDIPEAEEKDFLKAFPNAKKIQ